MVEVTVLFFASYRQLTSARQAVLELPDGACVADLKARLQDVFPLLADALDSALVAIDREYAFDEQVIPDGAEAAIFPPVSGGKMDAGPTLLAIAAEAFDINAILAQVTTPETGATCIFSGMVRAVTERGRPHATSYLEYEAYQSMAEVKLRQVADEIRERWPSVVGIAIVQRVGRLAPGTPTVLVACSAAHRDTGVFEAARYGIDRFKEIVPVWKKEVGPSGEAWIEGEYIPTKDDRP